MIVLALPVLAIVVVTLHDVLRRPTLRRLALRNATRRKGESVLVLVGSLLGTAIITAAFLVGDTLGASIRDFARTRLGPADEAVRFTGLDHLDKGDAALRPPVAGTDGTLRMVRTAATAATLGRDRRAEPNAALLEVDFAAARRFGGDAAATGFTDAGPTPRADEALVGTDLARRLELRPGSTFAVYAYSRRRTLRVRQVLAPLGIAGFGEEGSAATDVFVAPGTIAALARGAGGAGAAPPDGLVLVSNDGGVFDGADGTAAVKRRLEARLEGVGGAEVQTLKRDLLDDADTNAKSFTQLFGGIGAFSVIAGVLLLVNIFVMLADERKSELGMMRALGLKRNQLVRAFGIEGAVYAVVASVLGAFAGMGVGRVIVLAAQRIFNSGDDDFHVTMRFTAKPASIMGGFLIGTVISLLTVWAASIRIGRLNVIRAIRDVPEPALQRQRARSLVLGGLGVLIGGLLFVSGVVTKGWFGGMAGLPIAAFSAVPLLARAMPRRIAITAACVTALVWGVVCFTVLPEVFKTVDIPGFVVQGVILVSATVALGAANADLFARLTGHLSGSRRALAARLGMAYPLARRFRTSMLLGMYALVIFTLTFLAVFSELFQKQVPRFTRETRAGYDLLVDSNPANPVTTATLERQPEVSKAAAILRGFPEFSAPFHLERANWPIAGFDEDLLDRTVPGLSSRQAEFASDRAAWRAVLSSPGLAVVSDFFLQQGGGPPEQSIRPGDRFTVYNRQAGTQRRMTVAGVVSSDWVFNGVMVGAPFARQFLGPQVVPNRHYVRARPSADLDLGRAADRLTGRLLVNGVDAESFASIVHRNVKQQEGFFTLMQGYLALGLLIGIAGLGVVMVRAVRERRRHIGMLRAMGFPRSVVRSAFLLEAVFVAVQGIVIGVTLALIVSYQLLTNSDAFGDQALQFGVPWGALTVLLVATLGASALAILWPAAQAARIKPAVALRIAD